MNGNNFYLDMQEFSKKVNCFVANGRYTPKKNGKINKYALYVVNLFNSFTSPIQENIDKLVDYAKKNFKFDSVEITNGDQCCWLTFINLVVEDN